MTVKYKAEGKNILDTSTVPAKLKYREDDLLEMLNNIMSTHGFTKLSVEIVET